MRITLYLIDEIINFRLPNDVYGSYTFDFNENDDGNLINVESRDGKWLLYSTDDSKIIGSNGIIVECFIEPNNFYYLQKDEIKYLIYVSEIKLNDTLIYKYNNELNLTIGKTNSIITYSCPLISEHSFSIKMVNGQLMIEKKSDDSIYVNKRLLKESACKLGFGDEVEIFGLRLKLLNGLIFINNIENKLIINEVQSFFKYNFNVSTEERNIEFKDIDLYNPQDYFSKSPRLRRVIERKKFKLSPPPEYGGNQEMPLILTLGPMLTMGLMSALTVADTLLRIMNKETTLEKSWMNLLRSGMMLVSMLLWPLITKFYNKRLQKRRKKKIIKKYTAYLNEKRQLFNKEMVLQKNILSENLLTVDQCLEIINHRNIYFWSKRIEQSDFLVLRIGIGNEKFAADISYDEQEFSIDQSELRQKADELIAEYKYIKDVPLGYSLKENRITAIMGNRHKASMFINNLVLQMLTYYSYEDIKIVVFTNEKNKENWEYIKYLNHNFTNERNFRFFASDYDSMKNVADYLYYEISNREVQIGNRKEEPFKPHYIIICDDYEQIKKHDFMKKLTESDKEDDIGFSLLIFENRMNKLPSKCDNFITIGEKTSGILINSYEEQEQLTFYDEVSDVNMMILAKTLSNIPIEFEDGISELPEAISFMEMEKVGKVEQLNILNRWNMNDSTTSLKAEIGVDEHGDLMYLDLHEKYHGPHGLIAGMTGSGKSEFIITYILAMAMNYSPDDISFILIDYKGGGLAFAFENKTNNIILPHLAGTITNLDKAEMDRTLVSIDSEVKRRQQIFNEARDKLGESTIDIYKYQRFYKEGKLKEAVPHLFIICDEFAELKSQQPEFMDNLISVARIGRSLGVHLILATQKPSGVVNDQIWSNSKFRVCLKVQDEADSKEMLKRPEAASLKQAGRYYLQVGFNEYFALGQSGWCGAKYYPSDKIVKQIDKSINFINDCGIFIKSIQASGTKKIEAQGEQLAAVMNEIIKTANKLNKKARRLWLENIPDIILEDNLSKKYNVKYEPYNPIAIIGEYDAPEKQEQGVVTYKYLDDGNAIIYGNDGSERELLLNSLIYSTSKNHTSEEVNYYIVDYGSESLGKWKSLPQVGSVVFNSEEDKFNNLLKMISEELLKRKKIFVDYGGEYKNYIKNNENKIPLIVVILNNFDSIYETNPKIYDMLPNLMRDSDRYGVIFITTGNSINSVPSKISQNCRNIYAFKLKDASDYSVVLGKRTKSVPREIFGRGMINNDGIHEFQAVSIVEDEFRLNDYIQSFINEQKQKNKSKAKRVPTLPDIIRFDDIKEEILGINSIPVGISKKDLETCTVDYIINVGQIISSTKMDNTKNFVLSLIQIFSVINNLNLIIIDPMKTLSLDRNYYRNYYTDELNTVIDKINEFIEKLIEDKNESQGIIIINGINKLLTKLEDKKKFNNLVTNLKKYEKIGIVIVDDVNKMKDLTFEPWFKSVFSSNEGIWIGRGVSEQTLLRSTTVSREMLQNINNNMGYLINDGVSTLFKTIDFVTEDGDEENAK